MTHKQTRVYATTRSQILGHFKLFISFATTLSLYPVWNFIYKTQ